LATGGGGHLFTNTTNPAQSSGEGIALAWKAGAAIEDLEFVQFYRFLCNRDSKSRIFKLGRK